MTEFGCEILVKIFSFIVEDNGYVLRNTQTKDRGMYER